jgi:tRNA-binding protein
MKPAQVKPTISADLLEQIDVHVGTILSGDRCPRFREAGCAGSQLRRPQAHGSGRVERERANPREIEGKQALFVVNLAPRKMAGMTSEGMLFDIGYADGVTPVLATPEAHVPDGTRAG